MRDKPYLKTLMEYNAWSNAQVYGEVSALAPAEIAKPRPSFLKSILVTLNHLLVADKIWWAHLHGAAHGFDKLQSMLHEDFQALWAARREMDEMLAGYLDGIDAEALEEVVDYELIGGNRGRLSRAMILTHIALHGSYHRGWVADMMGQVPAPPPFFDIPVYERALREGGLPPMP